MEDDAPFAHENHFVEEIENLRRGLCTTWQDDRTGEMRML